MTGARCAALIANTDEYYRIALHSILRSQLGFSRVVESNSLDEALERLVVSSGISLAVFDLSVPGIHSPMNLRALRESFPDLRIAVVSESPARQDILDTLEAGIHGYIPKDLGVAGLTTALNVVLNGDLYVPPVLSEIALPQEQRSPSPGDAEALAALTRRQRDVLQLLVQGKSNKEIARALNLGQGTVKVHLAALFRTMNVRTRSAAAAKGVKLFK